MQNHIFSLKTFLSDSAGYSIFDCMGALLRFLLIYIYTRALPPEDFGLLGVVYITISLSGVVIASGLPSAAMIRFRDNTTAYKRRLQNSAFSFIFSVNMLVILGSVSALLLFRIPVMIREILPWALLCVLSDTLIKVPEISIRYSRRIGVYGSGKVLHVGVMLSFILYFYMNGMLGVCTVVASEAIGAFSEMVFYYVFDRYIPSFRNRESLSPLLRLGLPLLGSAAVIFLIDFSDRYLVYSFIGSRANGFYSAAGKIATVSALIVKSFNLSWDPYFYRCCSAGRITSNRFHFSGLRVVLLFSGVFSLLMIILPLSVHVKIMGRSFVDSSYTVIQVLIAPLVLAGVFKIVLFLYTSVLEYNQKTLKVFKIFCAGVAVNLAGNIIFTVFMKEADIFVRLKGVALMTSAAYLVSGIYAFVSALSYYPEYNRRIGITAVVLLIALSVLPFIPVSLLWKAGAWGVTSFFIFRFYFSKRNLYSFFR